MAKTVNITAECEAMLKEAALYIAKDSPKQASILFDEFDRIVEIIETLPGIGIHTEDGMLRMGLGKFRYDIYYREKEETIEIVGIWHTSRGTKFKV